MVEEALSAGRALCASVTFLPPKNASAIKNAVLYFCVILFLCSVLHLSSSSLPSASPAAPRGQCKCHGNDMLPAIPLGLGRVNHSRRRGFALAAPGSREVLRGWARYQGLWMHRAEPKRVPFFFAAFLFWRGLRKGRADSL